MPQLRVADHGIGNEGQGPSGFAGRLADQVRRQIKHPVNQPVIRSGCPIMHLVLMQHDHLAWQAEARAAAIAKGLDARKGDADCIGVVAVR